MGGKASIDPTLQELLAGPPRLKELPIRNHITFRQFLSYWTVLCSSWTCAIIWSSPKNERSSIETAATFSSSGMTARADFTHEFRHGSPPVTKNLCAISINR